MQKQTSHNPNNNYNKQQNFKKQFSDKQHTQKNSKELEEIREAYNKIQKKIDQYEEQNKQISNDNKQKSKKINELTKITTEQENKIQKIKNTVSLSLHQIEDTQQSNIEAEKLLKENILCQNGDEKNIIHDFTVYSIIYSDMENNNAQFLICKKRKKEYWLADSKKSGYKQIYKNGVMLKQVFDNQQTLPSSKNDIKNDKKSQQIKEIASRQLKEQLCIDIEKNFNILQGPEPFIQKNYGAVYYRLSQDDFIALQSQTNKVLEKVHEVINNDLKSDEYDDSLEKCNEGFEKLMKKYGWDKSEQNNQWVFKNNQIPQITLSTTFKRAESLDFIKGASTISGWKSSHQRLDWYFSIIENLKKQLKFDQEPVLIPSKKISF